MDLPKRHIKSAIARMTGTGIGERTRLFLHGAAWTLLGGVLAKVLSGSATLLAQRCMGPVAFGEASLALAAGLWIQVPMLAGIPTALMHYLPPIGSQDRLRWSSIGLGMLFVFSTATLLLAVCFQNLLSGWLGIAPYVFKWTLFWCVGYTVYTASVSWVSAEEKFSMRAGMDIVFAGLFLVLIASSRILKQANASNYMKSYCVAYTLVGLWGFYVRRRQLGIPRDRAEISKITGRFLSYGMIVSLGGVASALLLAPARLMANHYLVAKEVGLLAVYQGGSIQISSLMSSIGAQVFFPIASRTPNKTVLRRKINQAILITMVPCFTAILVLLAVYFKLLGKNWPFNLTTAMVYSFSAYLSFVFGILCWYYASMGRRGLLIQCLISLLAGGINLAACWLLIPQRHVVGAGMAYALGTMAGIVVLFFPITQRWSGLES
jgi:O-antigen/teichoic acid export membrane protein